MHRFRTTLALVSALVLMVACSGAESDAPTAPEDVVATTGPGYVVVSWMSTPVGSLAVVD